MKDCTNKHLHRIFNEINHVLWESAEAEIVDTYHDDRTILQRRARRVEIDAERLQGNIAVYLERQTAMMSDLIKDVRFSKFPLPRKRIPVWTRLQARFSLWKSNRFSRACVQEWIESHRSQRGPQE